VFGDPHLGSHLENAIEVRAQQVQNRVRNEQIPLKERFDRPHSVKEDPDSSSAADDSISKESRSSSTRLSREHQALLLEGFREEIVLQLEHSAFFFLLWIAGP
jgi:hypothetical protein